MRNRGAHRDVSPKLDPTHMQLSEKPPRNAAVIKRPWIATYLDQDPLLVTISPTARAADSDR